VTAPGDAPGRRPGLAALLALRLARRDVLRGGLAAAAALLGGGCGAPGRRGPSAGPLLTFRGVPPSHEDRVVVPEGYVAEVLYAWGDPVSDGPAFRTDAGNSAEEQARQAGMHHDGMHFFPLPPGPRGSARGLLAVNHEYTDEGLLHAGGMEPWTPEKVAKSQAAHGVSIVEVAEAGGRWQVVRPSAYARRLTARTPIGLTGPAAGHPLLRTAADPSGLEVLGTLSNCAHGHTPWGTYLSCEENFNFYFANPGGDAADPPAGDRAAGVREGQARYGITRRGLGYRWHEHDERFDAGRHPHEPHRFGWVVEVDPFDPGRRPVKHTALGRFKHEGATVALAPDGRVVVYMADDERGEYVYKFVSEQAFDPGDRAGGLRLLERGTLHVARFDAGGRGEWLPLVHGRHGLDAAHGFAGQAEVVVYARRAADLRGATPMDRPEWIAVSERTREVYCSLSHNARRGTARGPAVDAANPRPENVFGHIIRWRERGGDPAATAFAWDVFVLCGDPAQAVESRRGTIRGDAFGAPDGLSFDARGVLWIRTDVPTATLGRGDYARLGHNQVLAADPATGEVRRFLTGPAGCEVTGLVTAPDGRTMFVNIQHPGETARGRSDPARPTAVSAWPDGRGRPRSATVVVRRRDGGPVGS
jgi:secreted PhoX family phosphatase